MRFFALSYSNKNWAGSGAKPLSKTKRHENRVHPGRPSRKKDKDRPLRKDGDCGRGSLFDSIVIVSEKAEMLFPRP